MKVLFLWEVPPDLKEYISSKVEPGVECIFPPSNETEVLLPYAGEAEVMVGWRPSRELLNSAPSLALFQNPGVGVQHLIPLFREFPGISLANSHGNTYFTAQHAVALLLALSNKILVHHQHMAGGNWRTGDGEGASIPLRDRTVGLLGFGSIGNWVAQFLSGWRVELIACKRNISGEKPPILKDWYSVADLHGFLKQSDFLIISLPQTTETEGLIGEEELNLLGPDGLIVNVGRGPVICEEALFESLSGGKLGGAGIDVWYDYEPVPDGSGKKYPYNFPFHELDNVVLSPHRAASPFSDLGRWGEVIENINRVAQGKTPLNLVDRDLGY